MSTMRVSETVTRVHVAENAASTSLRIVTQPVLVSQQVTGLQGVPGPQGAKGDPGDLPAEWEDPPDYIILFENGLT